MYNSIGADPKFDFLLFPMAERGINDTQESALIFSVNSTEKSCAIQLRVFPESKDMARLLIRPDLVGGKIDTPKAQTVHRRNQCELLIAR